MWKILFIIVIAFVIGKFFFPNMLNFNSTDIDNIQQQTIDKIKTEKTINKFNQAEKLNEDANKNAIGN